jgi:hypothetical protein
LDFAGKINFVTQKTRKAQKGAITDGWYMGPAEIAEMAEILEPSQMAIIGHTDTTDITDIEPSQMAGMSVPQK